MSVQQEVISTGSSMNLSGDWRTNCFEVLNAGPNTGKGITLNPSSPPIWNCKELTHFVKAEWSSSMVLSLKSEPLSAKEYSPFDRLEMPFTSSLWTPYPIPRQWKQFLIAAERTNSNTCSLSNTQPSASKQFV